MVKINYSFKINKIKANSSLCGGSSRIRYAIQDNGLSSKFII
uniref:Transposase n=1 Tax=Heterorhabditis bacteriophora TaxID=37862 RepID=A0A1I7WFC2_HETBA